MNKLLFIVIVGVVLASCVSTEQTEPKQAKVEEYDRANGAITPSKSGQLDSNADGAAITIKSLEQKTTESTQQQGDTPTASKIVAETSVAAKPRSVATPQVLWQAKKITRPEFALFPEPELLCNLKTKKGTGGGILSIDISPNGRTMAVGHFTGTKRSSGVTIWDIRSCKLLHSLTDWAGISVSFSPNGKLLATGHYGGFIKLWETNSWRRLGRTKSREKKQIEVVLFSPNGRILASASSYPGKEFVRLMDARNLNVIFELSDTFSGGKFYDKEIAFSPDGNTLASSVRGLIRLWDVRTGKLHTEITNNSLHKRRAESLSYSHDGQILAAGLTSYGGLTNKLIFLDARSSNLSQILFDANEIPKAASLYFAPDNKTLASGHYDGTRLWDVKSGQLIRFLTIDGIKEQDVRSIAFTPNGRILAVGSGSSVLIWRIPDNLTEVKLSEAWRKFVASYNLGKAGLRELDELERIHPELNSQYKQLATYEAQQQKIEQMQAFNDQERNTYINEQIAQRLTAFLNQSYDIKPPGALPKVIKGEFEKTAQFVQRAQQAEADYRAQVARYNNELAAAQARRSAAAPGKRNEIIGEVLSEVYGSPELQNLQYNADEEVFYAELIASNSGFAEQVHIPVPIAQGPEFKKLSPSVEVEVHFSERAGALALDAVQVAVGGKNYQGKLTNEDYKFVAEVATIDFVPTIDTPDTAILDDFFAEVIKLENDPEAERLLAEIAAEKERQQALQRETQQAALRQRLEQQLSELRQSSRGVADPQLAQAVAELPAAAPDSRAWLLAIGVEDYMVAPDVPYADNSLELVSAVLAKRFGIPESNRVVLQGEQASGTFIRGNIRNTLGRLGPEDKLYFYYSGHGMPGRKGDQLYLAPRDIVVAAFEDEAFAFANLLGEIQQARVGQVVAFLDTCFSGKAGADELVFQGVAPITESAEQQLPDKMTVFYAGTGAQFANSYDDKGHRLFSYFLAQGLVDGLGTVEDLERYVSANVAQQSRAKGVSYEQTPFVDGRGGQL